MRSIEQEKILLAIFQIVRPIASVFLRFGLGYVHFEEVFKAAFLYVASEEFGLRGRQTNISRVAVITGLTRKEVAKLRSNSLPIGFGSSSASTVLEKVLHRWTTDQGYLDNNGTPMRLPYYGDEPSFLSLVKGVGGDVPPGAVKTELKRFGAIVEVDSGILQLVKGDCTPNNIESELLHEITHGLARIADTIVHNANSLRLSKPFYQRIIDSSSIPKSKYLQIEHLVKTKVLTSLAELTANPPSTVARARDRPVAKESVGVCAYFFTDSASE